jgi:hypothetical protein
MKIYQLGRFLVVNSFPQVDKNYSKLCGICPTFVEFFEPKLKYANAELKPIIKNTKYKILHKNVT